MMMEGGIIIKDVIVDLFSSLHLMPFDIQSAVIDALEEFVLQWLSHHKLPLPCTKLWRPAAGDSTSMCNLQVQSSDLVLLFAGSQLLPQLFIDRWAINSDGVKNSFRLTYAPLTNVSAADNCRIGDQHSTVNEKPIVDLAGPVLATDVISVNQLNCGLTEGDLEHLARSGAGLPNGTFSGVYSSQECDETESVDCASFDDAPCDQELSDSDYKPEVKTTAIRKRSRVKSTKKLNSDLWEPEATTNKERRSKSQTGTVSEDCEAGSKKRSRNKVLSTDRKIKNSVEEEDKESKSSVEKLNRRTKNSVEKQNRKREPRIRVKKSLALKTEEESTSESCKEKTKDGFTLLSPTVCEICGAVVKCLKSHMQRHSDPKHQCPFCPFVSRQLGSVNIHIRRRHTNYRPHLCEECGKSFVKSTLLKEHIKDKHELVAKERPFHCSMCNYKAYTRSILNRHEAKHAKNRRPEFRCEECGARLMTLHSLKEHKLLSHSEARPFPCALCGFATKSAKRLRSHMRTHGDKAFQCDLCPKKFTLKPQLVRHQLVHSGDKPFTCPYCAYKCAIVENLRKHCRAVHKLIYPPKKRDVRDELCGPNVVVPLPGASTSLPVVVPNVDVSVASNNSLHCLSPPVTVYQA